MRTSVYKQKQLFKMFKMKKHVSEYMELGHFLHVKKYKMEICYHINEYFCDVTNRNIWVYKSYLFPMTFS